MSDWSQTALPEQGPGREAEPPSGYAGQEHYPFWGYDDLALFIGAALPCALVSLLVVAVLPSVLPASSGRALPLLLGQFTGYALWFTTLYLILKVRHGRPFWSSLSWSSSKRGMALCFMLGPAVALGMAILGVVLRAPETPTPMNELLRDRGSVFAMGVFATTMGPLCEELAFRGFLLPLLARSFGNAAAVVLAALPFAVLHGPQYSWSWVHVVLVGAAGVCFGLARLWTRSTAAAVGMHATYNLTFFSAFLIQGGYTLNPW
ncbi:MAG: CPBP family intramembrane metalloprotease [Bryobacterales bacterium]|nr:CPBP family intramembrane metalloprotease [Bryobacterales bacterium]